MARATTSFSDWFARSAAFLIVGSLVASFALTVGILTEIASDQNARALERSRWFLKAAVDQELQTLATTGKDYADWGEAYKHLHPVVELNWAYSASNVGPSLWENYRADFLAVMGPEKRTSYMVVRGQLVPGEVDNVLHGGIRELVERARQAGTETVPVTGFLTAGDDPVLAVAAVIATGSDSSVKMVPGPASVLVLAFRLTPERLAALAARFFVPDLRLANLKTVDDPIWTVSTEDGLGLVALSWTPERPGDELLTRVLPWVGAAAIFLVLLTFLVVRHSLSAARALRSSSVQLEEAHRHAQHLAMHDALTGLPNRIMLGRVLSEMLASRRPDQCVGLLYLDLDRFKPVNDALGHPAGDAVLTEFSRRLRSAAGANDLVARIGGDEFVVATKSPACASEVEALSKAICAIVIDPVVVGDAEIEVGVSVGVALAPSDAESADELIRMADIAMYRAKSGNGGGHLFYSPDMNNQVAARRAMEVDMRRAIASDEFVVHFQPRFNTQTLDIVSIEALARWEHPTRGLLAPGEFIALAEEAGLIAHIDRAVLRKACATIVRYPEIAVSVNLSPAHFRTGDVPKIIAEVLAQTGLPAARLELEITEGVLLEDTDKARSQLEQLKSLGVTLAMDDFGTGYSSLGYLQTFPFDRLKIDRAFVARLEQTGDARAIVQAIIGLGRALGLAVTAEGVETAEQLKVLQADGCGEVQGFLLARPMPEEALAELMTAPRERDLRSIAPRRRRVV
jgi:diguanylate cyclase (GGDEF)-like protein